jgi:hypothetical protein
VHEWTQEWLVFEPGRSNTSLNPEALLTEATALGMDAQTDDVQEAKKVLFAARIVMGEGENPLDPARRLVSNLKDGLATALPTVFRAQTINTPHGAFGYVRIFTFNVRSAQEFVDEFVRLAAQFPRDGLIIDVRGNGGGLIHAAECLLQVLTPRPIEPQPAQFISTTTNLHLCRAFRIPSALLPDFSLGAWIHSLEQSVQTGAIFSSGFPMTTQASANDRGQCYFGPALLITDALCYSATDIFAAGFQDHEIGPVLGVHQNTGAGGANVWSHRLLLELMRTAHDSAAGSASRYHPLPHGSDLRVAIRRMLRVGPHAGNVLEDLGIVPDHIHPMTRNDVLHGNVDLIAEAARILASMEEHSIQLTLEIREPSPVAHVETHNVDWITVRVDGRPWRSFDMDQGPISLDRADILGAAPGTGHILEIQGFRGNRLVAATRKPW